MGYRTRKTLVMVLIILIFSVTFMKFMVGTASSASDDLRVNERKFFTSYVVKKGDTLWSIAEQYITEEYKSYNDYIDEIKTSNHIGGSYLQEGQLIVLPYYADEPLITGEI